MLAVFILSLSLVYTQAGSMVAKTADDASTELEASFKKVDDSILSDYADDLTQNAALKSLEAEQKVINQLVDDLNTSNAELMNYTIEHTYRDAIAKKLDALVAIEASVTNTVRTKMVSSVTADALSQISKDRKIKDAVLDQAIAVLAAGPDSKLGKDIIGGVFQSSLKTYRDSYASKASEFDSTLKDLTKDIDAIATAPEVVEKGGNVYTNHAIKTV